MALYVRHLIWDSWNVPHIVRKETSMNQEVSRPRRIPEFANREEEAAFWETHDLTDYLDELKPVEVRFAKKLSEGITIRLTPAMHKRLQAEAQRKGVGPSTLARMWIVEHLSEAQPERPARNAKR
jgi:predicted HicB family RNase H-like nuclease